MSGKNKNTVKVRILRDCTYGLWGEVAEIPTELLAGAEAQGLVDSAASAVAYAEKLAKEKPRSVEEQTSESASEEEG